MSFLHADPGTGEPMREPEDRWVCRQHRTSGGEGDLCGPCERRAAIDDSHGLRDRARAAIESARELLDQEADELAALDPGLREQVREVAGQLEALLEDLPTLPDE